MHSLLLLPLLAQLAAPNVTLTVDGKRVEIRHVCAFETQDFSGKPLTKILLAGTAPAEGVECADVERRMQRESQDEEGPVAGLSAVLVRGATGEWEWTEGMIFLPGLPSPYSSSWPSGDGDGKGPSNRFTPAKDGKDGVLAGRLWTARANAAIHPKEWKLEATFAVPLQKRPPVTEITGAAAESHPAMIAVRKYIAAMRSGNRKAMHALQHPAERAYSERMMSERWEELAPEIRRQGEEVSALPRVTLKIQGRYATVDFAKAGTGPKQMGMVMKEENGAWWYTNEQP